MCKDTNLRVSMIKNAFINCTFFVPHNQSVSSKSDNPFLSFYELHCVLKCHFCLFIMNRYEYGYFAEIDTTNIRLLNNFMYNHPLKIAPQLHGSFNGTLRVTAAAAYLNQH